MSRVFLTVLNMSLTASYAALTVIAARFFLNKAPKIFSYALWIVVLFRLLCPFTLESHISLIPSYTDSIPENIGFENPAADTGDSIIDNTVNNTTQISLPPANPSTNVKPMDVITEIGAYVWIAGIIILSIYGAASCFKLKTKLTTATLVDNNIFETDQISTPFVLGIIRPKIFIPVNISENELDYIVKHEQTHIKRYDYIIKLIAFTSLMIHWFNPLMWISYFLMSKDMEMSCDESVMKGTNEDIRINYSNTLLSLSVKQSRLLVPLAFGESNVKSRIKNILNYKKPSFWIFAAAAVIVLSIVTALGTNPTSVEEYQFPVKADEIEKVLAEQKIDWYIKDHVDVDESRIIFTLTNDDNITFGIDSQIRDNNRVFGMTWYLPGSLAPDKVNDFYHNELSKHFKLAGIFYGNKRKIDKALIEMMNYYLDNEENYKNGLYWSKRAGNDHLKVKISPMLDSGKNQIVSLLIMPDESYEDYLRVSDEGWKNTAESDNINVFNSTVANIKESVPPVKDEDIFSKHFVIRGHLEDIKKIRAVPEPLKNINSGFLMPNRDKYLSAKLVDSTGSIDVYLQMTSLNANELYQERNHNVTLLYYNNKPLYIVRSSVLYSEEMRAQETAKKFIMDLYTVNAKEVDNYKSILNLSTSDVDALTEAIQINDEVLESLTTDDAYGILLKNRENLKPAQACHEGNYTLRVEELQFSENKNKIENNEAGYNFEAQLKFISNNRTETAGTAKGLIELEKIDGNWKITGYRNTDADFIMD